MAGDDAQDGKTRCAATRPETDGAGTEVRHNAEHGADGVLLGGEDGDAPTCCVVAERGTRELTTLVRRRPSRRNGERPSQTGEEE
jgi:hypothetical protein